MEHDEAIRSQAAERYAAHELSPAEQDAFEEHFFDCRVCADDVRFELAFTANARAVFREQRAQQQPAPARARFWEKWRDGLRLRPAFALSFAANFVLAAGFGYVLLTGTHESAPPRFIQPYFAPGPAKGAGDVHAVPAGETWYEVRFPAASAASQSYSYEILDAAGKRESSRSLPAPAAGDGYLDLQVPVRSLPAGIHTLVVRAPGGDIVSWSRFRTIR